MANTLLGIGLKFIPTPKLNTSPDKQITTLKQFECDFSLKVFFAGDTDNAPPLQQPTSEIKLEAPTTTTGHRK
jgi:hypothetical protein